MKLVVLISGTGRNLQAIIDAIEAGKLAAEIAAVISNKPDAQGLKRAEQAGIPTRVIDHRDYPKREDFDHTLGDAIESYQPDLIALAGFMRILGSALVQRFAGRMVNIHPSLLPKYPGLDTHRRALAAGDAEHGATVHLVTDEMDAGPGILQGRIGTSSDDTAQSLAERVMQDIETKIYPEALRLIAAGRLRLSADAVYLDGAELSEPLQWNAAGK